MPVCGLTNNWRPVRVAYLIEIFAFLASILENPLPDIMEYYAEGNRVGESEGLFSDEYMSCSFRASSLPESGKRGKTYSVGISPIFNLVGSTDFAIAVENIHASIAWRGNLIWVARKDHRDSLADIFTIFSNSDLANLNPFYSLVFVLYNISSSWSPFTSRIEFFGPAGSWPGTYPKSLIVMRVMLGELSLVMLSWRGC